MPASEYEVRDIRAGGFCVSEEEMKLAFPTEHMRFMKQVVGKDSRERDHFAPVDGEGNCRFKSTTFFVKVHAKKDWTSIDLGTYCQFLTKCTLATDDQYPEWGLRRAYIVSPYNVCAVHIGPVLLAGQKPKKLGLADLCAQSCQWLPVFSSNGAARSIKVSYKRPTPVPAPSDKKKNKGKKAADDEEDQEASMIGISIIVKRMCLNCLKRPTLEDFKLFKKCKRCWDSMQVSVWYCSAECHLAHYPKHQSVCKSTKTAMVAQAKAVTEKHVCLGCSLTADELTVHLFRKCKMCIDTDGTQSWFCSDDCEREFYPLHKKVCKLKWIASGGHIRRFSALVKDGTWTRHDFPDLTDAEWNVMQLSLDPSCSGVRFVFPTTSAAGPDAAEDESKYFSWP